MSSVVVLLVALVLALASRRNGEQVRGALQGAHDDSIPLGELAVLLVLAALIMAAFGGD